MRFQALPNPANRRRAGVSGRLCECRRRTISAATADSRTTLDRKANTDPEPAADDWGDKLNACRRRQQSVAAILDRTFGQWAESNPDLWERRAYLMLIGLVVTNAIVLIALVEQLRKRGFSIYDALMEGGRTRVRPILMTAFTTSFALLPLALIIGESAGIVGAELATVVIGGLMTSTFLTLVVIPVIYSLLRRERKPAVVAGASDG